MVVDDKVFSAMAVCHHLPRLSLDRPIPKHVLQRRGAISFSSSTSLFKSLPRLERRGGISFDRTDKAAIYVRMLGDVRVNSKQLMTHPDGCHGSHPDDYKIINVINANVRRTSLKPVRGLTLPKFCRQHTYARPQRRLPPEYPPHLDSYYCGQTNQLLSKLSSWDFNIFHLDQVTGGHAMRHVGMQLFQKYDLIRKFHLDPTSLYKCLVSIETGYHNGNPYHNALHAADVTQAMYCYLQEDKLHNVLEPIEVMSAILASATHDLDHPGVNQVFLIATNNHLAALYGNSSVLENHHWHAAVAVLRESRVFDHLEKEQWNFIVEQISSLILATDIARQQEFLQKLKKHLDSDDLELSDAVHKNFILQIALKCADICNTCRQPKVSRKWSEMVTEEFFNQGDQERKLQLPLTPNCDRYKYKIQQIQTGFMTFVVEPLFTEWGRLVPTNLSSTMLCNVAKNKAFWASYNEAEKAAAENDRKNQLILPESPQSRADPAPPPPAKQLNDNNNTMPAVAVTKAVVMDTIPQAEVKSAMEVVTPTAAATDGSTRSVATQGNVMAAVVNASRADSGQRPAVARSASLADQRKPRPLSVGQLDDAPSLARTTGKHRMHSNPSSPLVARTQNQRQFSLRLHRTPECAIEAKKPANYEDPWLVRKSGESSRTSRSSAAAGAVPNNSGGAPLHPVHSEKARAAARNVEFAGSVNVNRNVRNQQAPPPPPRSPRLEMSAVRGHGLHSVASTPPPVSRGPGNRLTAPGPGSPRDHGHVADRAHRGSPRGTRQQEDGETDRRVESGRSLAGMGSPWIRKRMEERDQRWQNSKSSSK